MMMKTFIPKIDPANRKWYVVDLQGATLGRVAVQVAAMLRGKTKPIFTPNIDCGDHVIAINAGGVKVSGGSKPTQLTYYRYTGYPGGLRATTFAEQMRKRPEDAFAHAVWRMLPKTKLGRQQFTKLHVYAGADHPHQAQKPEMLNLR
jgi:large subunit ribosomal protein L13